MLRTARTLFGLWAVTVTLWGCTPEQTLGVDPIPAAPPPPPPTPPPPPPPPPPAPAKPPLVVTGNQTVADTVVGDLTVRSGGKLTVSGTRVVVEGKLVVEPSGSIEGTGERLDLVVRGDLRLSGPVVSAGHLVLVDDAGRVPTTAWIERPRDTSGLTFFELPALPDSSRRWSIEASPVVGAAPGAPALLAAPSSAAGSGGGGGGGTMYLYMTGNLRVGPAAGAAGPLVMSFPNGANGADQSGCNVVGGDGKNARDVDWTVEGSVVFQQVTLSGGNGGRGGDVESAAPCPDGAHNRGGKGGLPGSIRIAVGSFGLVAGQLIADGLALNGWDWGRGGDASIDGMAGVAPGGNGASVTATGGNATTNRRSLYVSTRIRIVGGGLVLSLLNGGRGGDAVANGGIGAPGICDPQTQIGTKSGDGGNATAIGGNANDVQVVYSLHPGVSFGQSFQANDGGNAKARGGQGGNGVVCQRKGGDGGKGGAGDANPGKRGLSLFPGQTSQNGTGTSAGGDAGWGGNAAQRGGHGGEGGAARVDGAVKGSGGLGGNGGNAAAAGGNGGPGGCPGGGGGAGGSGAIPGLPGDPCPPSN